MRNRKLAGVGPRLAARTAMVALLALAASACRAPGVTGQDRPAPGDTLVPPGHGTLRQDQFTLSLRSGDLLIKVTPLDEGIIRLAAPDTYDRLRGIRESHAAEIERQRPASGALTFLVSIFSYEPDVTYQPETLEMRSFGLRYRPMAIFPITPGWGTQRLSQQETRLALYAFEDGIDLGSDLEVEYLDARSSGWDRILSALEAERGKVRARSGG